MVDFGVNPEGFNPKTFEDIFDELGNDEKALIDPDLDVTTNSVAGQFNSITARQSALTWQGMEVIYNFFNPDSAEGVFLDNICKLTGVKRLNATKATVLVTVNFSQIGILLESGVFYVSSTDNPLVKFTPVLDFTSSVVGDVDILFEAENDGPINMSLESVIDTIVTPTFGAETASSLGEKITDGEEVESDIDLRARRVSSLTITGAGTIDAIKADLEALTQDLQTDNGGYIKSASVFEATTLPTDKVENPHSIKVIIDDTGSNSGTLPDGTPFDWDQKIRDTIWNTKPGGIGVLGDIDGFVTDNTGSSHKIPFSRVQELDMNVEWTVSYFGQRPDETEVLQSLATTLTDHYTIGEDIIYLYVASEPLKEFDQLVDTLSCTVNGGTSNYVIDYNERGRFLVENMSITFVEVQEL